jgi:hypothetical protein
MDGEGTAYLLLAVSFLFLFLTAALASGRRSRPIRIVRSGPPGAGSLLEAAKSRLREKPFDRMTESEKTQTASLLQRADAFPVPRPTRAEIHLALGEMALLRGDRSAALRHFRMVLVWEPRAGVRRTVEALEARPEPLRERPTLRRVA